MKTTIAVTLGTALPLLAAGPALADRPGPDWIDIEHAIQSAKNAGYTQISKIEADDGRWEMKAIKDGRVWEFRINPRSGAVSNEHLDD